MPYELISGCQAAAFAAQRAGVDLVAAYPITPQTAIVETLANFEARGELGGEFISVESEYSALSYCNGAVAAGARVFTATSSHGLAYMHEMIQWCSGARFPIVMVNVNRTVGAPWVLDPDQGDSLSQRDTGWMQIYCASAQEVFDTVLQAFMLSEELLLPTMVVFDGFYISHTYEPVDIPDLEKAREFIGPPKFEPQLTPGAQVNLHGLTKGENQLELVRKRHEDMLKAPEVFANINEKYQQVFGRSYKTMATTIPDGATTAFITAGSTSETVKWLLPELHGCGLIQLRMFRPFPAEELGRIVEEYGLKRLIIIDRNCTTGTGGYLAQEARAALYGIDRRPAIKNLILAGGIDLTEEMLFKAAKEDPDAGLSELTWGADLI